MMILALQLIHGLMETIQYYLLKSFLTNLGKNKEIGYCDDFIETKYYQGSTTH